MLVILLLLVLRRQCLYHTTLPPQAAECVTLRAAVEEVTGRAEASAQALSALQVREGAGPRPKRPSSSTRTIAPLALALQKQYDEIAEAFDELTVENDGLRSQVGCEVALSTTEP